MEGLYRPSPIKSRALGYLGCVVGGNLGIGSQLKTLGIGKGTAEG
jgi:hypothetical protein